MLVLTRKRQERIQIGDNITLTVVKVKGNTVRLGIEAPRNVRIVRGELPRKGETVQSTAGSVDSATTADGQFCELGDGTVSERQYTAGGDDTGEPNRLHHLVAKVRQASTIAHAV